MVRKTRKFVSRGGEKLSAAISAFGLDARGWICADFGCSTGGFTDCLLKLRAKKVYAVDTGYGELAWTLRNDPRVVVMERTNALYCDVPEAVDLVVIDVGWTPQKLIVPAAMRWVRPGGKVVSLLKPHYELAHSGPGKPFRPLIASQVQDVCQSVCERLKQCGWSVAAIMRSPLLGKGGNEEYFLLLGSGQTPG